MMADCTTPTVVHVISAVGFSISSCLTIWLAHRRALADRKSMQFYREVRQALNVDQQKVVQPNLWDRIINGQ